jgi:hypothetical protein
VDCAGGTKTLKPGAKKPSSPKPESAMKVIGVISGSRPKGREMSAAYRLLEAAGCARTRAAASLGAWDIIGIGSTGLVLCLGKTRDWPGTVEMETLKAFLSAGQLAQAPASLAGSTVHTRRAEGSECLSAGTN